MTSPEALTNNVQLFRYPAFPTLPHTDYGVTVTCEVSKEDKPSNPNNGNRLEATIELRVQQKYALILEPIKGQRVSLEDDFVVSPELTFQFKIPLPLFAGKGPDILHWQGNFVSANLSSLPINAGLAQFLKPHILHHAGSLAQKIGHRREFKMIFSVLVTKIDLADAEECDRIRRGWLSSIPGCQNLG